MEKTSVNNVSISVEFARSAMAKVNLSPDQLDTLLYSCRLPASLLLQPQARISLRQFAQLVTALTLRADDEFLGHAYQPVPLGSLSMLMHWLVACDDMAQVLQRLSEFYRILGKGVELDISIADGLVHIRFGDAFHSPDSQVYISEYGFFYIHRIICWLIKDIFPIAHLQFPFAAPDYARDYRLMFYGAPASFNCDAAVISFPQSLLQHKIAQNNDSLKQLLADPFTRLLILTFDNESWSSRVANQIQDQLDNLPSLPELAGQLNIAPYTLQRRLAAEGVTYLSIKNQMKRDAAIEYLVSSRMTIEEISYRLGFSETSPFTRTFKDWTGVPPSAYRKHR